MEKSWSLLLQGWPKNGKKGTPKKPAKVVSLGVFFFFSSFFDYTKKNPIGGPEPDIRIKFKIEFANITVYIKYTFLSRLFITFPGHFN